MSRFGFGHLHHGHCHGHCHHGQNPPAYPPAGGPQGGAHQPTFKISCKADEGYCLTVLDGNVVVNPRGQSQSYAGGGEPTVRIYCKADEGFIVTVRNGTVCLEPINPRDDYQHWIKDMRHSNSIKDEEGYPAFALVNRVTGEAIKHSLGEGHPLKLVPSNPNHQDKSVLWTESKDVGHGFPCIRMVNFDAFHGDRDHGGVRDGTNIVPWKWCEGDNQRWKIVPWCKMCGGAGAAFSSA